MLLEGMGRQVYHQIKNHLAVLKAFHSRLSELHELQITAFVKKHSSHCLLAITDIEMILEQADSQGGNSGCRHFKNHLTPPARADGSGGIVLIEDNEHFSLYISQMLKEEGYVINAFKSLETAIPYIKDTKDSQILMDYYLCGDSPVGCDALQEIKNLRPDIQIIITSACGAEDRQIIGEYISRGIVDGFLEKPPTRQKIRALLSAKAQCRLPYL